jgi:RNA polymerase sigma-70 factor (ECF subfamily)
MKRSLKEKFLYNRLKKQDQEAFAEIYDLFVEPLYRFIYFKVNNKEEAQDLTSEVFLKAWNSAQNKGELVVKTLPAFLYRIARNTVIDHYRKKKNDYSLDDLVESGNEPTNDQDPDQEFDANLDLATLETALHELKDEYREVIVLRYVEDLSTTEIAAILDKNKGAVRVLQYRAQEALKKILGK